MKPVMRDSKVGSVAGGGMRWLFLPVALLLLGGCDRGLLTHFPHRTHLAKIECGGPGQPQCLSCISCHQGDTTRHDAWAQPTAQSCAGCHQDKNTDELWQHSVRPALATLPAGKSIVFSHENHLKKEGLKGQCVKCHAGAVGVEGGAPLFPPMETCLGCHEHREQFETNTCTNCHKTRDLRGLQPQSFLPHDAVWIRRHGGEARANPERCATCHAQTNCDTCHDSSKPLGPATRNPEALEANYVHRFDFLSRHPMEARSQPGQCATCHAKTECDACHISRGVSGAVAGGPSPHPLAWASGLGTAANLHGPAARRDIGSCASCHDQGAATNCVRCHKVGATGGTPHPTGWRSTQPTTAIECAVCHGGMP